MVSRYANLRINQIFSDEHKLELWQKTELAVIKAMVNLNLVDQKDYDIIATILRNESIDIEWWKKETKKSITISMLLLTNESGILIVIFISIFIRILLLMTLKNRPSPIHCPKL